MRRGLLLLALTLLLGAASASAGERSGPAPDRVLTAAQLRAAGASRPAHLLRLLEGWDRWTVDGFTWWAAPSGLASPHQGGWLLMMDDHVVELDLLGRRDLNRLPLQLGWVDSVEIYQRPVLVEDVFAARGLIRIHTSRPERFDIRYRGSHTMRNETGDPGPWRYVRDRSTPNVDKIGPDDASGLQVGGETGQLRGQWVVRGHFPTDPAQLPRTAPLLPISPKINSSGVLVDGSLSADPLRLDLLTASTSTEDYLYHPGRGWELPSQTSISQISGRIATGPPEGISISTLVAASRASAAPHERDVASWRWQHDRLRVEGRADLPLGGAVRGGAGWFLSSTELRHPAGRGRERSTLGELRFWLRAGAPDHNLQLLLAAHPNGVGALLEGESWLSARSRLRVTLSHQELPDSRVQPWGTVWRDQWPRPDSSFVAQADPLPGGDNRLSSLDLASRTEIGPWLVLELGSRVRFHRGTLLVRQVPYATPDEPEASDSVPLRFAAPDGVLLGASASLAARPRSWLEARMGWRGRLASGGDVVFVRHWAGYPDHRLLGEVLVTARGSFFARFAAGWESGSRWELLEGIGTASGGRYDPALEERLLLDLSLSKGFWEDRLRLGLAWTNLLNDEMRYHPLGATVHEFAYTLRLEAAVDGAELFDW